MLSGAPVVYDKQQEIRQLLIDEVKRRGEIRQADYFVPSWSLVRGSATGAAAVRADGQPSHTECACPGSVPQGTRFLRIIGTNDFHGALEPRPDPSGVRRGGAAYVGAAIDRARRECAPSCETLVLDGGDMFQGTPASNLSYGRPVVDYYNRMGYAAAALGNHEFDWGVDSLRARMRQARFGILGANVRYTDGRDVTWIRNDTIVTRGRTRSASSVCRQYRRRLLRVPAMSSGFDSTIQRRSWTASAARSARRGADFVVVIAHAGGTCGRDPGACNGEIFDFAKQLTTKVDAIVSGHSHSLLNTAVNGIPIVQARSTGRAIDVLDLPLGAAAAWDRDRMSASWPPTRSSLGVDRLDRSARGRARRAARQSPLRHDPDAARA